MKPWSRLKMFLVALHVLVGGHAAWIVGYMNSPEYEYANTSSVQSYTIVTKWAEGYQGEYSAGERAYFKLKSVEPPFKYITLRVSWSDWVEHNEGDRVAYELTNSRHKLVDDESAFLHWFTLAWVYIIGLVVAFAGAAMFSNGADRNFPRQF